MSMFKTFYDIGKTTIWGERKDNEFTPKFVLSFRDGNPRIVVYTGEQGSVINFPCDYTVFMAVLERLEVTIKAPKGYKTSITSLGTVYKDDKPTKEKRLVSTLHIGKSKDGVVYLFLEEETKRKVVFAFKKNEWHEFFGENKEPISEEEMSCLYATGYLKMLRGIMTNAIMQYTSDAFREGDYKPYRIDDKNNNNFKKTASTPKKEMFADDFSDDIPY